MDTDSRIREVIREKMQDTEQSVADVARLLGIKHQSLTPLLKGERGRIPKSLIDLLDTLDLELVVQSKDKDD